MAVHARALSQSRVGRIVDGKRLETKEGRGGIARYRVEMV